MGELESWIKSEWEKVDKQDRIEEERERLHRVAIQRLHNQTLDAKGKANRMQYSIGERLNRMEYVLNKLLETLNNNTTK
jgi:ribosome-associated translation inhibitor RaiA